MCEDPSAHPLYVGASEVCSRCDGKGIINEDYWSQDADDCPDCTFTAEAIPRR